MKNFYAGIVIVIAIHVVLTLLNGLFAMSSALLNIPFYVIIIGTVLTYTFIFIYLFRLKNVPQLKIYHIVIVVIFYFIPKDFLIELNKEELSSFLNTSRYIETLESLFLLTLLITFYFKGNKLI
ncbi:hypothetical protein M2451_004013 [Dysgonomonas sp. PFB1-18]|nr:hypothetical protein [Dysgonomonas sp. PF1-14]MDH6340919.1 hypothetical protein [Dysgonomonas sp. PF1-16]MDH6382666.1 hypothetical protein [Dysgonomonas sp. PFB1-18]MDH6399886.1 hypothetical protein [Dysgonomonas sp. PF1-23]